MAHYHFSLLMPYAPSLYRTSKSAVEDQKKAEVALGAEVDTARGRISEIQNELESVVEQLGEAKVDKHESARAAKKAELIDNLKRLFPGVVGFTQGCSLSWGCFYFEDNSVVFIDIFKISIFVDSQ